MTLSQGLALALVLEDRCDVGSDELLGVRSNRRENRISQSLAAAAWAEEGQGGESAPPVSGKATTERSRRARVCRAHRSPTGGAAYSRPR
jgi:hypothetical protein